MANLEAAAVALEKELEWVLRDSEGIAGRDDI